MRTSLDILVQPELVIWDMNTGSFRTGEIHTVFVRQKVLAISDVIFHFFFDIKFVCGASGGLTAR